MLALMAGREVDAAVTTFTGYDDECKTRRTQSDGHDGQETTSRFPAPAFLRYSGLTPEGKKYWNCFAWLRQETG